LIGEGGGGGDSSFVGGGGGGDSSFVGGGNEGGGSRAFGGGDKGIAGACTALKNDCKLFVVSYRIV